MMAALESPPDYCFPSGADHFDLLQYALALHPESARLHAYMGNLLYHHRRHEEAIEHWEASAKSETSYAQVWRNLGIAYFNIRHDPEAARTAFDQAMEAAPWDARLLYEADQLHKRIKVCTELRLQHLERKQHLVGQRDDLSVELASLLNQQGQPWSALERLLSRQFHPWEGGEGLVLAQYTEALLAIAQSDLKDGRFGAAIEHLMQTLNPPSSLGEARHLLENTSKIFHLLGRAHAANGDVAAAELMFSRSAAQLADFHSMAVTPYSEASYWSGLSLQQLGRTEEANTLFQGMLAYAAKMLTQPASIDYFATSLPTLLLFDEDLEERQRTEAERLVSLANKGLGR
jgi:tetratricopeptide (TPR) repeat protein